MGETLTIEYDKIGDFLFIDVCHPYAEQDSNEIGESLVARFNLENGGNRDCRNPVFLRLAEERGRNPHPHQRRPVAGRRDASQWDRAALSGSSSDHQIRPDRRRSDPGATPTASRSVQARDMRWRFSRVRHRNGRNRMSGNPALQSPRGTGRRDCPAYQRHPAPHRSSGFGGLASPNRSVGGICRSIILAPISAAVSLRLPTSGIGTC